MLCRTFDVRFVLHQRRRGFEIDAVGTYTAYEYDAMGNAEMGAAYATLIGLIGHACFTYLATRNVFKIEFEFGRLLTTGVLATAFCVLGNYFGDGYHLVPYKLLVFCGWLGTIWFCGILSAEEKVLVMQQVSGLRDRVMRKTS